MSTNTRQRAGIWIIAVVMAVGTLGSFFIFMLPSSNTPVKSAADKEYERQLAEYQKEQLLCPTGEVKEKKIDPLPVVPPLSPTGAITDVRTEDVTVGNGQVVKSGDCIELIYYGVLAKDAKAFSGADSYKDGIPYRSRTTSFVPGMAEGLIGMKVGGERKIFIPAAKAYGEQANGDIPANSDLIFVVRVEGIYSK